MMTLRLKVILLIVLGIGIIFISNLIRKRKLELKYALSWLMLEAGLFLIVLIPGLMNGIAHLLGIYDATNMVFLLGFIFAIVLILNLTMSLSRNLDRVRRLAQESALNNYELFKKKNEKKNIPDKV